MKLNFVHTFFLHIDFTSKLLKWSSFFLNNTQGAWPMERGGYPTLPINPSPSDMVWFMMVKPDENY